MKKRKNKLFERQKAIQAPLKLNKKVRQQLEDMTVFFTPSMNVVKALQKGDPKFNFHMDQEIAHVWKTEVLPWTVAYVIYDRHPTDSKRDILDTTTINRKGTYEEVLEDVYQETQEALDKMNPNRRGNIAIIARVAAGEFSDEEIDDILATDPDFHKSTGIETQKDKQRRLSDQIGKLEKLVGPVRRANEEIIKSV